MKKKKRIIVCISLVLCVIILGLSCTGCSAAEDRFMNNLVDGFLENQNSETTDNKTDTDTDSTTDNVPEASTAHKLVFDWDGDFYYVYAFHNTEKSVLVGAATEKLKPNTEYEVKWAINPLLLTDTEAYFPEGTYDGKATYYVNFDYSYTPNSDSMLKQPFYQDDISSVLSNKHTFTYSAEGDVFFIGLFRLDYVAQEDLDHNIDLVFDYIKYIEITEVTG